MAASHPFAGVNVKYAQQKKADAGRRKDQVQHVNPEKKAPIAIGFSRT